jgi:hypothetical protein
MRKKLLQAQHISALRLAQEPDDFSSLKVSHVEPPGLAQAETGR